MFIKVYEFIYDILDLLSTFGNTIIDWFTTEINILNWTFSPLEMIFGGGFVVIMGWLLVTKVFIE